MSQPTDAELEASEWLAQKLAEREGWPEGVPFEVRFTKTMLVVVLGEKVWQQPRLTEEEAKTVLRAVILEAVKALLSIPEQHEAQPPDAPVH